MGLLYRSTRRLNREVDFCCCVWRSPGSNLRPLVYKASDLTTAQRRLRFLLCVVFFLGETSTLRLSREHPKAQPGDWF